MMMKKGLFGKSMMPGAMQPAYSMPQNMAMKEGGQLGTAAPQQQQPRFWQGGEKFTLRDGIAAALAVVGDGLSGGRGAVGSLMQSRGAPAQEAARLAEEQRKRAADLADYRSQMQIKSEFETPEAAKPKFEQDGAGNVWALDPVTGRPLSDSPVFIDRTERIINQNGALIRIPNPYAQGQQSPQGQVDAPDTLPADFFKGGTASNGGGSF